MECISTDPVNEGGDRQVHLDPLIMVTGLLVGVVVGLTGMGGGALMTPLLVLLFKVQPLAAVSSDLVAAVVMKPVGAGVHLRRGTVHLPMVRYLVLGSVPAASCGVLILKAMGDGEAVQDRIKVVLGVALLVAATSIVLKARVAARRGAVDTGVDVELPPVRPLPTVLVGVLGGLVVGARVSSRAPDRVFRPVLVFVLALSALKLLGVPNAEVGGFIVVTAIVGLLLALRSRPEIAAAVEEPVAISPRP